MADRTFALNIAAFVEKVQARADLVVRKLVLDMGTRIVMRSPVDTGRFRANWRYGLGQMDRAVSDDVDPSGQETIGRLTAEVTTARFGDVIYLSNSLPYALRLENGWSKQAPAGMVGITVAEFEALVDRAADAAKAEIT
ncbi:HK97 gp10 family phage protein [Methylobacterium sp. JK268]